MQPMTTLPSPVNAMPTKSMVPDDSHAPHDYILRIKDEPLGLIEKGKKNYEYRKYTLGEGIERVWLYEDGSETIRAFPELTHPTRLVLTIGGVRTPGQVKDPRGEGNEVFDKGGKEGKFGYPILHVLRFPRPITKEELLKDFGIDMGTGRKFVTKTLARAWPTDSLLKIITHEHL